TSNSEINVLAVQVAEDVFLVPERYVALRRPADPDAPSALDRVNARQLFDAPVDTAMWDRWVESGEAEPDVVEVTDDTDTAALRSLLRGGRNAFPLTVVRDDRHVLFAGVDELHVGDRIHVLRHHKTAESLAAGAAPVPDGEPDPLD
ncbi:MAG: hypothetical protein KY461_15650, partial [Actinobacteria bacterium]|nr:hypothetical protein [Actinomycetota bacterium]